MIGEYYDQYVSYSTRGYFIHKFTGYVRLHALKFIFYILRFDFSVDVFF